MAQLWEIEEFQIPAMLGFIRALDLNTGIMGNKWLPDKNISDLSYEYILGALNRPVMAHVMGYDSEAPIHAQAGVGAKVVGELPPIKRKARIGEKTLARFNTPRYGTADVQEAIDDVFVTIANLFDSVQARVEWLRLQALSEDSINYDEAGVIFNFDFGVDDNHQIDLTAQGGPKNGAGADESGDFTTDWADKEHSNPVLDIQAIQNRVIAKTGRTLGEFVVGSQVMPLLQTNRNMMDMVRGTNAASGMLAPAEINNLFGLYNLPQITLYNTIFQRENEDGTYSDIRPLAPNKAFAVPSGFSDDNNTLWGPTAEARVLYGTSLANQAPGIWAEQYSTTEPPAQWMKVAATAFPTMPSANALAQMTITAPAK